MNYYIWTIGCQMNKAESLKIEDVLQAAGFQKTRDAYCADLVILNTCVVRQHAEDKVLGTLSYLKGIKHLKPTMSIIVTGCFVGSDKTSLYQTCPYVDLFFKPGELSALIKWLNQKNYLRNTSPDAIGTSSGSRVRAYIPIIQGCNNFCSYCIVPYRRGREKSRPIDSILSEASDMVNHGVREIILLGQNVNAYGKDIDDQVDLSLLLSKLSKITKLKRIRFLTNHPKDMSSCLIQSMAALNKVCHHVCLPLQSGDNSILKSMNRHYTLDQYQEIIAELRNVIPDVAISTDIIVGFPGESEEQYMNTYNAINNIKFDAVHAAVYSPRPGTLAAEKYIDDVPYEVKMQRLQAIEALQRDIAFDINQRLTGIDLEILVEAQKDGKWFGRTYSDKPVFFKSNLDLSGQLARVRISKSTPWSLQGELI